MSFLDGVTHDNSMDTEKDVARSFGPMASDIYDLTISMAYQIESAGGAIGIVLDTKVAGGKSFKETFYITTKKKETKDKNGNALPGFLLVESLCLLTAGEGIFTVAEKTETKLVNVYDSTQSKEVPKEVPVLLPLIGKKIKAGLIHRIENKQAKNATSGAYEDVPGKIRESNTVNKFFHTETKLTVAEIYAKKTEPLWHDKWLEDNKGAVEDRSSKTAAGASSGKQSTAFAGASADASTEAPKSLFAGSN